MGRVEDRLLGLKLNQFTLVVLRSCNLLTIFNLLVFTTNEFIVIRHPLHYRRYFRRRTVLLILLTSWVVSVTFGMGSVFTNFPASAHSVLVRTSDQNGTLVYDIGPISAENGTDDGVTRRELDGVSVNMVSMLMIFALCYACLATVLICYGIILRTIRQFHAVDNNKGAFHSEDSQRVNQRSLQHRESRRESHATDAVTGTKRCNSHRRWRIHLMSRHKYLIVIGSVLFVDVLFLLPYSAIQMVAFLHLNNFLSSSSSSTLIRWSLQIIIGVHSVCQPLCYFRMNEFRRLACGQRRNSQSFSQWHKSF
uniref:G-protein coupled receptors family 1 profile domain-containing protein n=1 Tax=Plectus sambesii TaxID=2011161 RepID=A0A914USU3_9BILA